MSTDSCVTDSGSHDFKMDDEDGTSSFSGANTTITLTACDDTVDEADPEYATMVLTSCVGCIASGSATISIVDNDTVQPPPETARHFQGLRMSGVSN